MEDILSYTLSSSIGPLITPTALWELDYELLEANLRTFYDVRSVKRSWNGLINTTAQFWTILPLFSMSPSAFYAIFDKIMAFKSVKPLFVFVANAKSVGFLWHIVRRNQHARVDLLHLAVDAAGWHTLRPVFDDAPTEFSGLRTLQIESVRLGGQSAGGRSSGLRDSNSQQSQVVGARWWGGMRLDERVSRSAISPFSSTLR